MRPWEAIEELILGSSARIEELRRLVREIAPTKLAVLIHGPTGSGKELVAQAVHKLSRRRGEFTAFNVCAIPESLFEATVFGRVRGAFTGSVDDALGLLLEASGGSAFLDEISGLPLQLQAKLLRVLETGRVRQVGAKGERASDFRLISATNEDLTAMVRTGRFRADLLYRIRGMTVVVPALAERKEDIEFLAQAFASRVAEENGMPTPRILRNALRVLEEHEWPGNVRELRHVVEVAVIFARGASIDERHVKASLYGTQETASANASGLAEARDHLISLLDAHGWDTAATALQLGVSRKTVYVRLKRLGIALPPRVLRHVGLITSREVAAEARDS